MNPITRMAQLAPRDAGLQLRHYIASADRIWLERFMHEAYSHRRVKGEWFRLSAGDVEDFCTINDADDLDQLPSWVVAMRVLNEAEGFPWGELDEEAIVPNKGGAMVRLTEEEHAMLKELAKHNDRKIIAEVRIAIRNHFVAAGLQPPRRSRRSE